MHPRWLRFDLRFAALPTYESSSDLTTQGLLSSAGSCLGAHVPQAELSYSLVYKMALLAVGRTRLPLQPDKRNEPLPIPTLRSFTPESNTSFIAAFYVAPLGIGRTRLLIRYCRNAAPWLHLPRWAFCW